MSQIDIKKLAFLSRLQFSEEAEKAFGAKFESVMDFVNTISEADTEGVPPYISAEEGTPTPERADAVTEPNLRDLHQQNAPKAEQGFYVVPKVVE
ncbi:MAG: Asp-tRNA(Asn)/Glu-tRNA(Gln) amidotransferase subunit GatC [Pseudomonadaceae bacterium]|nr:Asp-tRNA(Asn)/Glu-tRNA(Gln) amidotransferase subunit GatC [Pseudomonadaceae bacterium]